MAREKNISLGGTTYPVEQLRMADNKAWRTKLSTPFAQITGILQNYQDLEINNAGDIAAVVQLVSDVVLGSVDTVIELLFEYSPVLAEDRARIEAEAYDDEAIAAFAQVLELAFPFGALRDVVLGPRATTTSQSLRSQNGATGTRKRSAVRAK